MKMDPRLKKGKQDAKAKKFKKKRFECDICGHTVYSASNVGITYRLKHIKDVHPELLVIKTFECDICHQSFDQSSNLTKHMKTHELKILYKCTVKLCKKSFNDQALLDLHKLSHASKTTKNYECEICNEEFFCEIRFENHIKLPHIHLCKACDKSFAKLSNFKTHIKQVHNMKWNSSDPNKRCNYEEGIYEYIGVSMDNGKANNGDKVAASNTDTAATSNTVKVSTSNTDRIASSNRDKDISIPTKDTNNDTSLIIADVRQVFQEEYHEEDTMEDDCEVSLYTATRKSSRKFVYQCNQCRLSFTRKNKLKVHLKSHSSNLKPNNVDVCEVCDLEFRIKLRYQRHISMPHCHLCKACGKRFTTLVNFKCHINQVHDIRWKNTDSASERALYNVYEYSVDSERAGAIEADEAYANLHTDDMIDIKEEIIDEDEAEGVDLSEVMSDVMEQRMFNG